MKIHRVSTLTHVRSAGAGHNFNFSRGKVNGLLITGSGSAFDSITVTLRTKEGVILICNRLNCAKLSAIMNISYGMQARNGVAAFLSNILAFTTFDAVAGIAAFRNTFKTLSGQNGLFLDFGSITLDEAELSVSFDASPVFGDGTTRKVSFYSVQTESKPDMIYQYDESTDFDQNHHRVRSAFFCNITDPLIDPVTGLYRELDFELNADDKTMLGDAAGSSSLTNIFGALEALPELGVIKLYGETLPVPTSLSIKVLGVKTANDSVIVVKEVMPSKQIDRSTMSNLDELQKRIEKMEAADPDSAKAYRHAGLTVKSEELQAVKEAVKESDKK